MSEKTEPVEGFDVFKSSKKSRANKGKEVEQETKDETLENPKKELYRQMEVFVFLMFCLCFIKGAKEFE